MYKWHRAIKATVVYFYYERFFMEGLAVAENKIYFAVLEVLAHFLQ